LTAGEVSEHADDGPALDSEIKRLDRLIQQIEGCVNGGVEPRVPPELLMVFTVTGTWLNRALTQAKAILLLATQGLAEAVGPLVRALWELWTEWQYLLNHGDRALNAAKVTLSATLEGLAVFEAHLGTRRPTTLARLKQAVQEFEAGYPAASAEVRAQREKRRYHWSGLSRSEMERTVSGTAVVYKLLSWEAHGVPCPVRDVLLELDDQVGRSRFGQQLRESDVSRSARVARDVLLHIYNEFARLWGLPPVVPPEA
jgi:hypothetical protein